MAEGFYLTESQIQRLARMLQSYENGELGGRPSEGRDPRWIDSGDGVIVGYLESAITGLTLPNSNPKPGTLSIYSFTSTGQTDTGEDETVYLFSTENATTSEWIQCKRDRTTGKWVIDRGTSGGGGVADKLFCRFVLESALATSDSSATATILTQWGPGASHATSITALNINTTGSTYLFSGSSGDVGVGLWSSGSSWYIVQMECP